MSIFRIIKLYFTINFIFKHRNQCSSWNQYTCLARY